MTRPIEWRTRPEDPIYMPERKHKPASALWALLWLLPVVWIVAFVIIATRLFDQIVIWR